MLSEFLEKNLEKDINQESHKFEFGIHGDFLELRPKTYKPFKAISDDLQRKLQKKIEKGTATVKDYQEAFAMPIARHLVVSWQVSVTAEEAEKYLSDIEVVKCPKREDSVLVPFSIDNAKTILGHERFVAFFREVSNLAGNAANFVEEIKEDDRKN